MASTDQIEYFQRGFVVEAQRVHDVGGEEEGGIPDQPPRLQQWGFSDAQDSLQWGLGKISHTITADWDPAVCEHCRGPMSEPSLLGSHWVNHCLRCGGTRDVQTDSPLFQSWQTVQRLTPYPDLLKEVGGERPWIPRGVFATKIASHNGDYVNDYVWPKRGRIAKVVSGWGYLSTPPEHISWNPGQWGKGFTYQGRPYTWPVDDPMKQGGSPHHYQMWPHLVPDAGEEEAWSDPITISPEGWYTHSEQGGEDDPTLFARYRPGMKYVRDPLKWERRAEGIYRGSKWDDRGNIVTAVTAEWTSPGEVSWTPGPPQQVMQEGPSPWANNRAWQVNIGGRGEHIRDWLMHNFPETPFLVDEGLGGWRTPEGEPFKEPASALYLYDTPHPRVKEIMDQYGQDHPLDEALAVLPAQESQLWKNRHHQSAIVAEPWAFGSLPLRPLVPVS